MLYFSIVFNTMLFVIVYILIYCDKNQKEN